MKIKQGENSFKGALGKVFGRRKRRRDSLVAPNISALNVSDGWRRTLLRHESGRF